jgi:hypothetical protein
VLSLSLSLLVNIRGEPALFFVLRGGGGDGGGGGVGVTARGAGASFGFSLE